MTVGNKMEMKFSSLKLTNLISRWLLLSHSQACSGCQHHFDADPESWAGSSVLRCWHCPGNCSWSQAQWPALDTGPGGGNTGHWASQSWGWNGKLSPKSIEKTLCIQQPAMKGHKIFHQLTNWTLSVSYWHFSPYLAVFYSFVADVAAKYAVGSINSLQYREK